MEAEGLQEPIHRNPPQQPINLEKEEKMTTTRVHFDNPHVSLVEVIFYLQLNEPPPPPSFLLPLPYLGLSEGLYWANFISSSVSVLIMPLFTLASFVHILA